MATLSRRKLAIHAAARLGAGDAQKTVLKELAAYLIDSHRTNEAELIVRDMETMLAEAGTAVGTITSARKLTADSLKTIESFIKQHDSRVKTVLLREMIDESLIGGVKLELPGQVLDASIKAKLDKLTA